MSVFRKLLSGLVVVAVVLERFPVGFRDKLGFARIRGKLGCAFRDKFCVPAGVGGGGEGVET